MPRFANEHPRVRALVMDRLVPLYWQCGSVNSLAEVLSQQGVAVYPNRLHALLSRDIDRGVNEATLEQLESATSRLDVVPNEDRIACAVADARTLWPMIASSDRPASGLAEHLGVPVGVAEDVIRRCGFAAPIGTTHSQTSSTAAMPDWSFQDDAERICLRDLAARPNARIGMIVPTGGGKTRIALRIALKWLAAHPGAVVVWVTHQTNLREQARRELQQMLVTDSGVPADAAKLLAERVEMVMVSKLRDHLAASDRPRLIIVDEAHHAAAPTYQPVFDTNAQALFLTATPNRTDELPLGIDQISYSITYRELAQRGVIILPTFQEFRVPDFTWSPEGINALADEIIERAATDFIKTLVLAPRIDRVTEFYDALRSRLSSRLAENADHPLTDDDIGFVHGTGNSLSIAKEQFLATFRAKPRAICVSAQLLLEGFDDPSVNTVVITYKSTSLVRLMQAGGRCVRYAPEKKQTFVIQARSEALEYYFDQRWLYQEISDRFRPELLDIRYNDGSDLQKKVRQELTAHRVDHETAQSILTQILAMTPGETCRLLLTGLPYFGPSDAFDAEAKWGAFLEREQNSAEFRWIFNDFSARGTEAADHIEFLRQYANRFSFAPAYERTSKWRQYSDVLSAIHSAAEELEREGTRTADGINRPFRTAGPTTWLRYVTFRHDPTIDPDLTLFLEGCYNAAQVLGTYTDRPQDFHSCIKLPLPGGSNEAHLLTHADASVFFAHITTVRDTLLQFPPAERMTRYAAIITGLAGIPGLPHYVIGRIDHFINDANQTYALKEHQ
jgi:superfamily II DNA or RNA helicase